MNSTSTIISPDGPVIFRQNEEHKGEDVIILFPVLPGGLETINQALPGLKAERIIGDIETNYLLELSRFFKENPAQNEVPAQFSLYKNVDRAGHTSLVMKQTRWDGNLEAIPYQPEKGESSFFMAFGYLKREERGIRLTVHDWLTNFIFTDNRDINFVVSTIEEATSRIDYASHALIADDELLTPGARDQVSWLG